MVTKEMLKTGMLVVYDRGEQRVVLLDTPVGDIIKELNGPAYGTVLSILSTGMIKEIYTPVNTNFNYATLKNMEQIYPKRKTLKVGDDELLLSDKQLKELKEQICTLLNE